ncbi:MAG: hypothetical protein L6R39_000556 [Caloplaca ligustica]|nr:MAG: hypothetical protein L6R39_000556 [Caloplaca ligustica]
MSFECSVQRAVGRENPTDNIIQPTAVLDPDAHHERSASPQRQRCVSTPNEQEVIDACAAGDIDKVKRYFEETNTTELGNDDYYELYQTAAYDYLRAAILNKRASLLKYLLSISPRVNFYGDSLLSTALQNPDLDTFRVIYEHKPKIVEYHYKHVITTLMESCCGGNPLIPNFLLDHGADPNWGGWAWRGGPLTYAVAHGQPLELIKKMVKLGAPISVGHMYRAIHVQRLDALEFLLREAPWEYSGKLLEHAHEYGTSDIIALVEKRARNMTRYEKKLVAKHQKKKPSTGKSSASYPIADTSGSRFKKLWRWLSRAEAS